MQVFLIVAEKDDSGYGDIIFLSACFLCVFLFFF